MALLIGQACSNERGEILNGAKGDQTGREVRVNTFFRRANAVKNLSVQGQSESQANRSVYRIKTKLCLV